MRRHQIGEVILAMMVVMLVVMWLASGLMGKGKMEEDAVHAEKSGSTKQQTKAVATPSIATKESAENQN